MIPELVDEYPVRVIVTILDAEQKPTTEGIVPAVGVEVHELKVVVNARKSSGEPKNVLVVLLPGIVSGPDPEVVLTTNHGPEVTAALAMSKPGLSEIIPSSVP